MAGILAGLFLISLLAYSQDFLATSFCGHPLVSGILVGFLFKDPKSGLLIGASLEFIWLGLMGIGATVPPDSSFGGILGTSLALYYKQEVGIAVLFGLGLSQIGSLIKSYFHRKVIPAYYSKAQVDCLNGEFDQVSQLHIKASLALTTALSFSVTLCFFIMLISAGLIIENLPAAVLKGLNIAATILPILGLVSLYQVMTTSKNILVFLLGMALVAFLNVPILVILLFGLLLAFIQWISGKKKIQEVNDEF